MTDQRRRQRAGGDGHEYTDANGIAWTFTPRPQVRHSEEDTHVVLLIESAWQARVATCPRAEWERPTPDYARILAESLPIGGSRGQGARDSEPRDPDPPGF